MKALAASLALALASAFSPATEDPANAPTLLEAATVVARPLARGESHRYRIELLPTQHVRLTARPEGIGLIITLFAPDGSVLTHVDAGVGGQPQELVAVARVGGSYPVEVRPLEKNPAPGAYRLTVDDIRPAGAREQRLLEAQTLFADAGRAKKKATAESLVDAAERYRRAIDIWAQLDARWWEAQALFDLCDLDGLRNDNQAALEDARRLVRLADELGADRLRGRALMQLGSAQKWLGDPNALEPLQRSHDTWARFDDPEAESEMLGILATVYSERGDKQLAIDYYGRALQMKRALGDRAGEATNLANIGAFYHELGEFQRAIEYYEQSLGLFRAEKDRRMEGDILALIAQTYGALGQPQKALAPALEAIDAARQTGYPRGEASAHERAGRVLDLLGQAETAMEHFRTALDIYRRLPDPQGESDTLWLMGRSRLAAGRPQEAIELQRQSLAIAQSIGEPQRIMRRLNALAIAERAAGDLDAARRHSDASLALLESLRGSLPDQRLRGSLLALAQSYYDLNVDLLMQAHRRETGHALVAAALESNERSRARSLLEQVGEPERQIPEAPDPALRQRDRELEKRLDTAAERQVHLLAAPPTPEQAAALAKEIQDLTREHDFVEAAMRAAGSGAGALMQVEPLSLAEIQRDVLDERTLLLEYRLGAERSYLWAVTREGLDAYELPKAAEIEASARRWHELLSGVPAGASAAKAAAGDDPGEQAAKLAAMLIAPAAGHLRDRRLLIVADGALQYVPFAALPSPVRPGTPLIAEHEVVSVPSASFVAVLRQSLAGRPPASKTLAVFADPVFDATDERVASKGSKAAAVLVPAPENQARDFTRAARDAGLVDGTIARLPFTRREAKAILSLVPAAERMEALDFAASPETASGPDLAQYRYVHFATHGFADAAHPELSGILLSLVDREGRPRNGFLTARQVSGLKLPADLVVLSGCRTALGKEIKGEGLFGLTRAFMSAGAARVVASLWKVDDAATAELMKTMYERIFRDGQRPAQALRSAQIAMWQGRRWQAPYYWAAFVIQGEWN